MDFDVDRICTSYKIEPAGRRTGAPSLALRRGPVARRRPIERSQELGGLIADAHQPGLRELLDVGAEGLGKPGRFVHGRAEGVKGLDLDGLDAFLAGGGGVFALRPARPMA